MEAQNFAHKSLRTLSDSYQTGVELFMCLMITMLQIQAVWQTRSGTAICKHLNAQKEEQVFHDARVLE